MRLLRLRPGKLLRLGATLAALALVANAVVAALPSRLVAAAIVAALPFGVVAAAVTFGAAEASTLDDDAHARRVGRRDRVARIDIAGARIGARITGADIARADVARRVAGAVIASSVGGTGGESAQPC